LISLAIRYLVTENGTRIDDPRKMAEELATQFTKTSHKSSKKKDQEEKEPIQVDYGNEEPYNSSLTEEEMDETLAGYASLDHIHYEFIKKMAQPGKIKILNAYEQIWRSSTRVSNTETRKGSDTNRPATDRFL
jgi:hypothetical protein